MSWFFVVNQLMILFAFYQGSDSVQDAERARQLAASGRPEQAVPIYKHLLSAYPSSPEILLNLGIAEFQAKQFDSAVKHTWSALKLKPDLAPAALFLGASYLELGQPASAVEPLRKAVAALPGDRNAHLMLAEAFLGSEQYQDALEQFRSTAELLPENPRVWYGLGQAYQALAESSAHQLQTTSPDSSYWLVLEGDSYRKQRRFGSAFALYREALAKGPLIPGIHSGLASIYRETGHLEWAAQEERLERTAPVLAETTKGATALYSSCQSDRQSANRAYDRLAQLPPSLESRLHRAQTLAAEGQYRESAAEWREALKLAPQRLHLQMGLARSLFESQDYSAVLPVLAGVLKQNTRSAEANFLYGASLLNTEQPAAAVPYLEAALQLDPQLRSADAALGQALLREGKPQQAIPYLKTALASNEGTSVHFQLFRAYQLTGNHELAKQAFAAYRQFQSAATARRAMEDGSEITAPPN